MNQRVSKLSMIPSGFLVGQGKTEDSSTADSLPNSVISVFQLLRWHDAAQAAEE
jgi:hypothetical protein